MTEQLPAVNPKELYIDDEKITRAIEAAERSAEANREYWGALRDLSPDEMAELARANHPLITPDDLAGVAFNLYGEDEAFRPFAVSAGANYLAKRYPDSHGNIPEPTGAGLIESIRNAESKPVPLPMEY